MAVAKQKGIVLSADEINRLRDGTPGMIWRTAKIQPPARQGRAYQASDSWFVAEYKYKCPFGLEGGTFYVKETWQVRDDRGYYTKVDTKFHPTTNPECARIWERSQPPSLTQLWIPATRMPQWASRFTLTVQSVVFKRLQDVTEEEARLSGEDAICHCGEDLAQHDGWGGCNYGVSMKTALDGFREAWDATHKKGNRWDDNLWQWGATVTMEQK